VIDLAVVAAILSSNEDIPVDKGFVLQEKRLSGEIRPVNRRPTHPRKLFRPFCIQIQ
jgi:predicted ATP-dependent serine protease